ncbi:hypothetical protein [Kitasatospora cineracea]|uniref:Uncharacterized protein n=1 Tax=Kitasatospora cineracea TaxID=88074 RepID=A0A8G1UFE1_9ACTN|nr:hypothetical protein [Kitasatospora cineracea]ROR42946.1 hypothetical protein EDD39_1081 [Kitasatospora cineracea]
MAGIDLDAARRRRLATAAEKAQAAKAEYTVGEEPIIFGGVTVAVLPAELPLAVWEPLIGIPYLPLLLRSLVEAAQSQGEQQTQAASLIVDVLGSEPTLPSDLLAAAAEMGRRLLGEDGFARLMEQRPSHTDVFELVRALSAKYFSGGAGLGELMGPSGSPSSGGTTSKPTSSGTTGSTPAVPGGVPVTLDSSAPAAS